MSTHVKSKLLVQVEKHRLFPGVSPMPVTAVLSDYRKVNGILVPHKVAQTIAQCGNKREMTFVTESSSFNVEMAPDQFDPPSEVLLAAKTSAIAEAVKGVLGSAGGGKSAGAPCAKKAKSNASPCGGK